MRNNGISRRVFAALLAGTLGMGATLGLTACGNQTQPGDSGEQTAGEQATTRTFTDSCGREVEIPANIERIAPSGALAQQVLLTIAPEKLCGLSAKLGAAADYVADVDPNLPVFGAVYGSKGDLNKEAIAEAAPDLIIDVGEAKKTIKEDMDSLQDQLGIPVVHIESSLSTYKQAYEQLGELLGKQDRAAELGDYCQNAYDEVSDVVKDIPESERPKVAYLTGDSGTSALAKGGFMAQVVDMVANNCIEVENATASGNGDQISLEQIAAFDPQMIVFTADSYYGSVATDPAWAGITAVEDGQVYEAPSKPYNWLSGPPSVNQIMGMQWLARLCYPDQFPDSMTDVAKSYYKTFYGHELTDEECRAIMANALPKSN